MFVSEHLDIFSFRQVCMCARIHVCICMYGCRIVSTLVASTSPINLLPSDDGNERYSQTGADSALRRSLSDLELLLLLVTDSSTGDEMLRADETIVGVISTGVWETNRDCCQESNSQSMPRPNASSLEHLEDRHGDGDGTGDGYQD